MFAVLSPGVKGNDGLNFQGECESMATANIGCFLMKTSILYESNWRIYIGHMVFIREVRLHLIFFHFYHTRMVSMEIILLFWY